MARGLARLPEIQSGGDVVTASTATSLVTMGKFIPALLLVGLIVISLVTAVIVWRCRMR